MILFLFTITTWGLIIFFFLIKKSLNRIENGIVLFTTMIFVTNIYTVIDMNLGLVQHSSRAELFLSLCTHRSIIQPLALLIYVNLYFAFNKLSHRIAFAIITLSILNLIEYLVVFTGIKYYTGWNAALACAAIALEMIFSVWLASVIKKMD